VLMVCGEALMDVFALGETTTGTALDARIGGSPFNVAVALARLAQPAGYFGAVSSGFLGERLMRALGAEGVDTRAVARTPAPTTLSLVGLDAQGVPSYAFYGTGAADRQLGADDLKRVPTDLRGLHVGSYATVVEPIASTLRALVERERGRALVAYDPNIRLNVEPDLTRWHAQLDWMLPRCHLLKISDEDLALLYPGQTPDGFAARALALGTQAVIVTRGAQGAQAWTANVAVSVPGVPVQVVDTVGAGDTFQAAVLTWLAEHDALHSAALAALTGDQWSAALTFAARAAAITCSRRGADMPRRHELN
jgi:fructokinase